MLSSSKSLRDFVLIPLALRGSIGFAALDEEETRNTVLPVLREFVSLISYSVVDEELVYTPAGLFEELKLIFQSLNTNSIKLCLLQTEFLLDIILQHILVDTYEDNPDVWRSACQVFLLSQHACRDILWQLTETRPIDLIESLLCDILLQTIASGWASDNSIRLIGFDDAMIVLKIVTAFEHDQLQLNGVFNQVTGFVSETMSILKESSHGTFRESFALVIDGVLEKDTQRGKQAYIDRITTSRGTGILEQEVGYLFPVGGEGMLSKISKHMALNRYILLTNQQTNTNQLTTYQLNELTTD